LRSKEAGISSLEILVGILVSGELLIVAKLYLHPLISAKITSVKLLLTSSGLVNKSITNALRQLLGKSFNKANLVFIPTAANVEEGDKWWLIDDLQNCKKLGFASIDIVDISALPKNLWQPRLEAADVLLFSGGNTFHLIYWIRKSGLEKILPKLLEERIYMGISAGSMVASRSILLSQSEKLYYDDLGQYKDEEGLAFVSFQVRPHFNSPLFQNARASFLKEIAKEIVEPIYAIDDQTAIKIVNSKVEVVSEGEWEVFNLG